MTMQRIGAFAPQIERIDAPGEGTSRQVCQISPSGWAGCSAGTSTFLDDAWRDAGAIGERVN
jgi:hypothetical protein